MVSQPAPGLGARSSESSGLAAPQRKLLFVLSVATFMVGLDGRVVAPLLPSIAVEFHVSVAVAGYLVSGYLLPYGLFQLAYGPLADRFGKVRVSAYAMVAFSVGTALCGVFSSFTGVLLARAFTGAAARTLWLCTRFRVGRGVVSIVRRLGVARGSPTRERRARAHRVRRTSGTAHSLIEKSRCAKPWLSRNRLVPSSRSSPRATSGSCSNRLSG
jgi:Major Facilitator Superfamily